MELMRLFVAHQAVKDLLAGCPSRDTTLKVVEGEGSAARLLPHMAPADMMHSTCHCRLATPWSCGEPDAFLDVVTRVQYPASHA